MDFLQNNLKTWITKEVKNNHRTYKIIDGTTYPMQEAHVFHKGVVLDKGNTDQAYNQMAYEVNKNFCDWYAKNRNEVRKFYENKQ